MTIETTAVIGLGTMGAGIAEVFARAGLRVIGVEANPELAAAGERRIAASLGRALDRGRLSEPEHAAIAARLSVTADRDALAAADLVIEAVPERLDAKAALFDDLDGRCPPETIFATNTSSLSVTSIAAATGRPQRVVGMHFFNPAPVMALVEVVETVLVDPEVTAAVREVAGRCGKSAVVVGDRAGFVANALLLPYLNHAGRLVETGRADVASLDAAMRELAGLPMGPLALADLIGLDVCLPILDVLWEEFRLPRYAASPLLRRLVAAGRLGRKTGIGWYRYDADPPAPAVPGQGGAPFDAGELLAAHLADALRMVDDGYATEADVDTAMRLGCGYPDGPFALLAAAPPGAAERARALAGTA